MVNISFEVPEGVEREHKEMEKNFLMKRTIFSKIAQEKIEQMKCKDYSVLFNTKDKTIWDNLYYFTEACEYINYQLFKSVKEKLESLKLTNDYNIKITYDKKWKQLEMCLINKSLAIFEFQTDLDYFEFKYNLHKFTKEEYMQMINKEIYHFESVIQEKKNDQVLLKNILEKLKQLKQNIIDKLNTKDIIKNNEICKDLKEYFETFKENEKVQDILKFQIYNY